MMKQEGILQSVNGLSVNGTAKRGAMENYAWQGTATGLVGIGGGKSYLCVTETNGNKGWLSLKRFSGTIGSVSYKEGDAVSLVQELFMNGGLKAVIPPPAPVKTVKAAPAPKPVAVKAPKAAKAPTALVSAVINGATISGTPEMVAQLLKLMAA
jgi:hypothetical protein